MLKLRIMEKIAKATLRHLFQEYLKAPSVLYSINPITDLYKADAIRISDYMLEQNWIRERWVHQNNIVTCRITVGGIEEVNPSFIKQKLKQLLSGIIHCGGQKSLTAIFENNIQEYAIALDFVYQLERLGLINILHRDGELNIELTAYGYQYFEKKGKFLFALMSIA
jgi:hypothetical protein